VSKVDTKTKQEILQRAWRVAKPGEIDRLVRQARGDGALQRELRQVKRQLANQIKRAKRAEAKLRKREAEKAARKARRERAEANTRGYVKPAVGSRVGGRGKVDYSKNWVTLTRAEKDARLADQNRGRSCTSGEYGDGTPTGGYSIENP
jgi:hypothetical protein